MNLYSHSLRKVYLNKYSYTEFTPLVVYLVSTHVACSSSYSETDSLLVLPIDIHQNPPAATHSPLPSSSPSPPLPILGAVFFLFQAYFF